MKNIELLAPAGSLESLKAAVNAGADAVYIGGTRFGARAYADNLTEEDMKWAIDYAHLHGVSLYMTINTLLKENELEEELYAYVKPYYEHGLDAVIVQDLGVVKALGEWFPDLPVHVSTQMTVTAKEGFQFLKEFPNITRIVTARELSLNELKNIRKHTDLEIESFIHGALCYCYSGQCLFSSVIGGRSGNRGRCAQPCRLPYEVIQGNRKISDEKEKFILSPKDLNTLTILPEILKSGINSLKIEGRMKRPEYTAGVVSIYRKYIDQFKENPEKELKISLKDVQDLEELFRKRGYSKGYYMQHNSRAMMALSAPENEKEEAVRNQFMEQLYDTYIKHEKKEKIKGILRVSTQKPMNLLLKWNQLEVEVSGDPAMVPKNRSMKEEDFVKQLGKTGNTPFEFEHLEVLLEDEVFVPNGAINELRRKALEELQHRTVHQYRRIAPIVSEKQITKKITNDTSWEPLFSVSVETMEQLNAVLNSNLPHSIYIDSSLMSLKDFYEFCETEKGKKALERFQLFYIMPPIFRMETVKRYTDEYKKLPKIPWHGFVIKNLESYQWLLEQENEKPIILDANLYTFNRRADLFWNTKLHVIRKTLPAELNYKELLHRGCADGELMIYGHLPMMISAGCVYKSLKKCRMKETALLKPQELYRLKDRKNAKFPVKPVCSECYNIIYNSQPLSLLNLRKEVSALAPNSLRILFTIENEMQTRDVLERFERNFKKQFAVEDLSDFTRGHFKRGVE